MNTYERTHTRPEYQDRPEWQEGYRFQGMLSGGGMVEKDANSKPIRMHNRDSVKQI